AQGKNNESLVDNAKRIVTSGVAGGLTGGVGAKANGFTESDELVKKAAGVVADAGGATLVTAGQRVVNGEELTGEGLAKDLATNMGSTIAGARAAKNQIVADENHSQSAISPEGGEHANSVTVGTGGNSRSQDPAVVDGDIHSLDGNAGSNNVDNTESHVLDGATVDTNPELDPSSDQLQDASVDTDVPQSGSGSEIDAVTVDAPTGADDVQQDLSAGVDTTIAGEEASKELPGKLPFDAKQVREGLQHEDALQSAINKEYNELADSIGLQGPVREVMNPLVPTDAVTDYRRAEYLTPAYNMGLEAAKAGDTGVFYGEIDIRNVSGLNIEMDKRVGGGANSGYYEANRVMGEISDAVRQPLERQFGADNVALVRKGGDEFGIVIKGNRTGEEVNAAFAEAYQNANSVAEVNGISSIPHPKDGQPGVGIYIGVEQITANSKMSEVLDSAGRQVEDAKKSHAAATGKVESTKAERDLPPEVISPTKEQIRKSAEMQQGMADIVDELGVQNPYGKFLAPDEFQKSAMAARAEIFGLSQGQHQAIEKFAASHRVDKDLVTGFAPPSERAPTYERLQGFVDERAKLGLDDTASVGRIDLRNMAGLNKQEAAEVANQHFKNIADIVVNEVKAQGVDAQVIPMRRGGPGFEVAAVGVSGKEMEAAFRAAEVKIAEYAVANGLATMKHPKWENDRSQDGIGIYAAATDIKPGGTVVETLHLTDQGVRQAEREHLAPSVEKYNRELAVREKAAATQGTTVDPLTLSGHLIKDMSQLEDAPVAMKSDLPAEVVSLVERRRELAAELALPGGALDQFLAREGVDSDSVVAFHYGSTASGRSSSPAKNNRLAQDTSDVDIMVFALDKDGQPWRRMEGQNMHFQVPDKDGKLIDVEVNAGYVADTLDQALSVDYGFDYVKPAFTQDLPPGGIRLR
ncbi:MAG: hypothetical protein PHC51_14375, partial [bacterium]|nr:hypothetical protein [bacterium]